MYGVLVSIGQDSTTVNLNVTKTLIRGLTSLTVFNKQLVAAFHGGELDQHSMRGQVHLGDLVYEDVFER